MAGVVMGADRNVLKGTSLDADDWFDDDDDMKNAASASDTTVDETADGADVTIVEAEEQSGSGTDAAAVTTGDYSYNSAEVQTLDIEMDAGELQILTSEDENIYVDSTNEKNKVVLENGRLRVISKNVQDENVIYVYLPEGLNLAETDVDIEAGSAKINNLTATDLDLEVGAGSIICTGTLTAQSASCSVEAGKMEIPLLDAQRIEFDCDAGELIVGLAGAESEYSGVVECDMGSLHYGASEYSGMEITQRVGQSGSRAIEAECEMGSIYITFAES